MEITVQELEFVLTVAETFNIEKEEYLGLKDFVLIGRDRITDSDLVIISKKSILK